MARVQRVVIEEDEESESLSYKVTAIVKVGGLEVPVKSVTTRGVSSLRIALEPLLTELNDVAVQYVRKALDRESNTAT